MNCKIQRAESSTKLIREISIDFGGSNYYVIYGEYINGGFFSIPNWNIGGDLSPNFNDIEYNSFKIFEAFSDLHDTFFDTESAAKTIATAICKNEEMFKMEGVV